MRIQRHPALRAEASPLWRRFVVLFALLLVLVAPVAQAGHIHGDWLPHGDAQLGQHTAAAQFLDSEANCPLCVAMHSALPAETPAAKPIAAAIQLRAPAEVDHVVLQQPHFPRFSRPPPTV